MQDIIRVHEIWIMNPLGLLTIPFLLWVALSKSKLNIILSRIVLICFIALGTIVILNPENITYSYVKEDNIREEDIVKLDTHENSAIQIGNNLYVKTKYDIPEGFYKSLTVCYRYTNLGINIAGTTYIPVWEFNKGRVYR